LSFVDLHSHVLPGLDDGVRTLPESLELIAALGRLGFGTVCATPHQRADLYLPARAAIDTAYEQVLGALPAGSPTLNLGAENFWDEVLAGRLPQGTQPTYTGGKAFLFEIPVAQWPPRIIETLFDVRMRGTLPVMAHPERYSALWNEPERVESIARTAALVIDLAALEGAHGANEKRAARFLVDEGFAHAAASDSHSLDDVALAAAGIAYIKKRHGQARVDALLTEGPRAILTGALPD
jgi:protein-tyrosine phosphatase